MLLGVDWGEKKIGLAIAEEVLAEPLVVASSKEQVVRIIKDKKIEKIIIGISEGRSAEKARKFGRQLEKETGVKTVFQDETLSTREAQEKAIEAGIKTGKRHSLEDAYAATLILQWYLDNL